MLPKGAFIRRHALPIIVILFFLIVPPVALAFRQVYLKQQVADKLNRELQKQLSESQAKVASFSAEIDRLNNQDLRKINNQVKQEIANLEVAYDKAATTYEDLAKLRSLSGSKTGPIDVIYASLINFLSKNDMKNANETLKKLADAISKEETRLIAAVVIPPNTPAINAAPGSGFRRQQVQTDSGTFLVDVVAADLNSTKVIIDTASNGTCSNDCPTLPMATYVSRSGAYAGVNGTYFCPETYPTCADKKNTFDVLVMNKNKVYFNSDNNVYSTVPVAIFSGNSARFIGAASGWGRDTGVDAVISNRPLLVLDGNNMLASGGEAKEVIRGPRSFLGSTGSTAYIGVVHGASVAEAAKVLTTMGVNNAINLDDGGSVALWSGGYKDGPGRNIPNAVLFVRK